MKICYIILTCEKYIPTRCVWQTDTWLQNVMKDEEAEFYYLCSSTEKEDVHYLQLNAGDKYEDCPLKYVEFFRNFDISLYDWVVFCDDDTYIFHNRLKMELSNYDSKQDIFLGERNFLSKEFNFPLMYGGSGFIMSSSLYNKVKQFVDNNEKVPIFINGDVTICNWVNHIENVKLIDLVNKMFSQSADMYDIPKVLPTALSFHYVTEDLFKKYYDYET